MSILPKSPQPAEMMTPRHRFAYQWLDNVELNEYAQFDSNMAFVSRIIRISTNWPRLAGLVLSKAPSSKKAVTHASG